MQRVRLAAITVVALLAVNAAAAAAWWMTGRSRATESAGGTEGAPGAEVEIEIPRAAGPSTVAQVDTIAALDPGKPPDAGAAEPDDQAEAPAQRPRAAPMAK